MAATAADIPLLISSENASSERRISPAWTLALFKGRLEPITGIPASCQRLSLRVASQTPQIIEAADEESALLSHWPLQAYAEIHVGEVISISSPVLHKIHLPFARSHIPASCFSLCCRKIADDSSKPWRRNTPSVNMGTIPGLICCLCMHTADVCLTFLRMLDLAAHEMSSPEASHTH
jgi:hypothetical protein